MKHYNYIMEKCETNLNENNEDISIRKKYITIKKKIDELTPLLNKKENEKKQF